MIHHIESERILSEVLNNEKLVIVDFFAEWCGPCQSLAPILKEMDEKHADILEIYKVNVDERTDCVMKYNITAMPTILFFRGGEEIERVVGFISKEKLENLILEL